MRMTTIGAPALLVVLAAALGIVIAGQTSSRAATGGADCVQCHEEAVAAFKTTAHGRAFQLGGKAGDCKSCHGEAKQHAVDGDVPADLVLPGKSKGEAVTAACKSCHANHDAQAYWQGSAHQQAGVSCADCHGVHRAWATPRGRKAEGTTELCTACHTSMKKTLHQRSRHPVKEGKMACTSCHNPHGSGTSKDLKADSANDLCWSCHQDKRGPFLWEHSPVREDCMTCHSAHSSNHEGMLVARTAQVCQSCHMQGRHQTVAGTETSMWYTGRQCVNCHSQIHGSNHPSGPLFMR